jgi:hypothetical protein
MFFRRKRLAPADTLATLLATPDAAARSSKTVGRIRQLLGSCPSLDLNEPASVETTDDLVPLTPELPLTRALQSTWDINTQVQIVALLLEHGARPRWDRPHWSPPQAGGHLAAVLGIPWHHQTSHFIKAVENGNYAAADLLLQRGLELAGDDDEAFGDVLASVLRAALSVHLPSAAGAAGSRTHLQKLHHDQTGIATHASPRNDVNISEIATQSTRAEVAEPDDDLFSPSMQAAAKLVESCEATRMARLRPGGAPSVVHATLAAFAEHVEAEARRKHRASAGLVHLPPVERMEEEARLKTARSDAVSRLLKRLWALLQLALASGSPAVSMEVNHFPCPPPLPLCDLDLVWSGVKNFATAWMPQWDRDVHSLYHPRFKAAVQEFAMIAGARGFQTRDETGRMKTYRLDGGLVERVVGHMAADQAAWVSILS